LALSSPPKDTPMASESFLYLLSELEQAVERGTIKWDAAAALSAQQRLETEILKRVDVRNLLGVPITRAYFGWLETEPRLNLSIRRKPIRSNRLAAR